MLLNPLEIYMVEDNPGDVRLTQEILKQSSLQSNLRVAYDGEEALDYLMSLDESLETEPIPHVILLDLNLPKKSGTDVLTVLKAHDKLKRIPVVVLTSSESEQDVVTCYSLHANSYITKPIDLDDFSNVINSLQKFWTRVAELPR